MNIFSCFPRQSIGGYIILFLLLLNSGCSSMLKNYQLEPGRLPDLHEYNNYEQDFFYLKALCEEAVPLADKYFPPERRSALEKEILKRLGGPGVTEEIFVYCVCRYLAGFSNQHAYVEERNRYIFDRKIYPVSFHYTGSELFVLNAAEPCDAAVIGKKVTAINGMPVSEVEKRLGETATADNLFSRRAMLENWFFYSRPVYYRLSGLIDSDDAVLRLEFEDHTEVSVTPVKDFLKWHHRAKEHPVTAKSEHLYDGKIFPDRDFAYFQFNACFDKTIILDGVTGYVNWWIRPFARLWLNRQFKKEKPSELIDGYYDPDRPVFKDYLASFIKEVNSRGINNLIIDLRHNNGGGDLGSQLVYHLTYRQDLLDSKNFCYNPDILELYSPEKGRAFRLWYRNNFGEDPPLKKLTPIPQNKYALFSHITDPGSIYYVPPDRPVFKGKVIVLVNPNTKSAAALLAAFLQDNKLAVTVGSTTDNNPTGPTGYTPFKLPGTGLKISLPSDYIERAVPENGDIFMPDYRVENTVSHILEGKDALFDKALELIAH